MMIEFCGEKDLAQVMQFINDFWKKDHILATSKEMFDYQYYDQAAGRYNMIISKDDNNELECVLGFIPTSRFDKALAKEDVIWLSLWKSREDASNPFIGIMVYSFLRQHYEHSFIATNGMSAIAEQLYNHLGFEVQSLYHLYIANPTINDFKIAHSPKFSDNDVEILFELELVDSVDIRSIGYHESTCYKNVRYLVNKYLNHPYYRYSFLTIPEEDLLIVCREITISKRKILRIIDFYGQPASMARVSKSLESFIIKNGYEYIDILISTDISTITHSKFILNNTDSATIIPNYFEPFDSRNVEIKFAMHPKLMDGYFVTKGDGDQDRPTLIKGLNI
ncbi:hypothetical protein [Psychrobacter sp. NC44]|uniref:hypothetical protein n=1 Tax=Psychrobacter sp. NC44 TaxID=2774130 RepID=UPI0019197987|nr:hypothetical protein [Psychrobacter sp. NC44]